jgi:hypothetical protein
MAAEQEWAVPEEAVLVQASAQVGALVLVQEAGSVRERAEAVQAPELG